MLNITLGLIFTMIANVLLGASLAKLKKKFNKEKFLSGGFKIVCISVGVGLMYLCSYLNPDIVIVSINNTNVNFIEAMKLIFASGIVYYGAQDINKLVKLLKVDIPISEVVKEPTIEVKQENVLDRGEK